MPVSLSSANSLNLTWRSIYSEAELYKAAVRLYTKPIFSWPKALATSSDQKTFYEFARHGLRNLGHLHRQLCAESFHFRPGIALQHRFNGKSRVLYVYPWEERLIDLLLYRLLTHRLHAWFSPHSYAYRDRLDLDRCQRRVTSVVRQSPRPLFVLKRDIVNYFGSVHHDTLRRDVASLVNPRDYLYRLLEERIGFSYLDSGQIQVATVGIPFGTAVACLFANVYLTDLDRQMSAIPGLHYFRYSDDFLALASQPSTLLNADEVFDQQLSERFLSSKATHHRNWIFTSKNDREPGFEQTERFRHLGLEFRADGSVGLSRDKARKLRNLFRFSFRRKKRMFGRLSDIHQRIDLAVRLAKETIDRGLRNVALLDYYLRHASDDRQWREMDRWLAEEVLSMAFRGGHRRSYFRTIGYATLRRLGLPSLVHRRQLLLHGHLSTPFFIWKNLQAERSSRGAAARTGSLKDPGLSLRSQKQRHVSARERERCLLMGVIED